MDVLKRFGKQVREKRTALCLSQQVLANKCGIDRTYLCGIERGKRNVALRNIKAISRALGISIADLMQDV